MEEEKKAELRAARKKYSKHLLKRDRKKKQSVFDKLGQILNKRLYKYISMSNDFKWLKESERKELFNKLFHEAQTRYLEGTTNKLGYAIDTGNKSDFDVYDFIQLCKDLDEILCWIEPKLCNVVEFRIKPKHKSRLEKNKINIDPSPKHYTKVSGEDKINILISSYLKYFPKDPTLAQLSIESLHLLKKGRISVATWSRTKKDKLFLTLVCNEIIDRLQSPRKIKQDSIDKLNELLQIFRLELTKKESKVNQKLSPSRDIFQNGLRSDLNENNDGKKSQQRFSSIDDTNEYIDTIDVTDE